MYQDSLMDNWERIRDLLRVMRGKNQWRGNEIHLLPKLQVRLEGELRGEGNARREAIIHLSDAEVELWAETYPGGDQIYLKNLNHDLEAFVGAVVAFCKGAPYLHTNSKKADYREVKS